MSKNKLTSLSLNTQQTVSAFMTENKARRLYLYKKNVQEATRCYFAFVEASWCSDRLAHNSCIFLGNLNSSWQSCSSISFTAKVERMYSAVLEERVNFYLSGMFLQESRQRTPTDSKQELCVTVRFFDWIDAFSLCWTSFTPSKSQIPAAWQGGASWLKFVFYCCSCFQCSNELFRQTEREWQGQACSLSNGKAAVMAAVVINTCSSAIRQDTGDAAAGEQPPFHSKAEFRRNSSALFELR